MYRLLINFSKEDFLSSVWTQPKEYLLPDSEEVCKVITSLSHLNPLITLVQISCSCAEEVLKDFDIKEV